MIAIRMEATADLRAAGIAKPASANAPTLPHSNRPQTRGSVIDLTEMVATVDLWKTEEEKKRDGTDSVWSPTESVHVQWNRDTENDDPRIRIRALELLGKISDVGLFAEKSEVTGTHQSTEDLRNELRGKLEKLVQPVEDIEDADYTDYDD